MLKLAPMRLGGNDGGGLWRFGSHFFSPIVLAALLALLTACSFVAVKLEGEQVINNRMTVRLVDAWNQLAIAGPDQPFSAWTQEGVTLDHLRLWSAISSNQALIALPSVNAVALAGRAARLPTYSAGMQPDQLVHLFEMVYAVDGSLVNTTKISPAVFAGKPGVRFEFEVVRKSDSLQFLGVGWLAVDNNQLFAATFVAPKLSFFKRLLPKAERVVQTARILAAAP